jgi:hypothetical protein
MAGFSSLLRLLLVASIAAGCGGGTAPEPVTRETPEKTSPPVAEPTPEQTPAAAPAPQEAKPRDAQPIVVDPGESGEPKTLVEAARAEKERRASAGQSTHVINDKTLPKYARQGQITIADPKKKSAGQRPPAVGPTGEIRDEAYWRSRARDIRERWRDAAEDVKELEQRATELRQKFYLESDTFTRDNQIKPEWDRVLERLRRAKLDVEATQKELAEFLDEGRTADVMPGWLREGEEEEPEQLPKRKKETGAPSQSIEPPVIEPPPATEPPRSVGGWK